MQWTRQRLRPAEPGRKDPARPPARTEAPPIRARGAVEILDTAVDVLVRRPVYFVTAAALPWILATAALESTGLAGSRVGSVGFLVGLLVQEVTIALVALAVYGEMQGHRVRASRALLLLARRLPALFLLSLFMATVLGLGFTCLFAPFLSGSPSALFLCPPTVVGILLVLWLVSVAPAALVLERAGATRSLRRSAELVRGSFGRWLLIMTLSWLLAAPFSALPALFEDPGQRQRLQAAIPLGAAWLLALALLQGVASAFGAIVTTIYYLDNRVRREGLDLEMRLERLEARQEGAEVWP